MTLPANRKLICVGSYRLTGRRLGKGNFARVEEAVHTVLKAKVALKVMNIAEIKEEYVLQNLHREAKLLSQLNHPCIAGLYETMQNGTMYYLVTELVSGGDLCSFIKGQKGGKLDERYTKVLARQLVSALAHMHSIGIVHRDLKMENIMLNETKTNLKIVDFGLSNIWSPDSPLHTHCGSPEYAAPELFLTGQLYGPEVDMWSLGVILYGMVMGQLPFLTSRDNRISSQERRKHLLSQINKGLSSSHRKALAHFTIEFRGVLSRLLVPDPSKRMMITDIMRHSWLTDHSKKPVKVNALCELDSFWRGLIIKEISRLIQIDVPRVEYSIRYEPYGVIGGMYNILSYRRMLQCNVPSKDDGSRRPTTVHSTATPSTVKQEITRPITSYPHGPHGKRPTVTWTADIHGTPSRLRVIGSVGVNRAYNLRSAANKANVSKHDTSNEIKKLSKKPDDTVNRKTKSESLNRKTATSTEKEVKRRKSQPVCAGKDPPNKTGEIQVKPRSKLTRSTLAKKKSASKICQHVHALNERKSSLRSATKQTSTPTEDRTGSHPLASTVSKKMIKEPIARCIAGYMSNYINLDVNKCKWIKDLTKMSSTDKTTKVAAAKTTKKTVRR